MNWPQKAARPRTRKALRISLPRKRLGKRAGGEGSDNYLPMEQIDTLDRRISIATDVVLILACGIVINAIASHRFGFWLLLALMFYHFIGLTIRLFYKPNQQIDEDQTNK